MPLLISKYLIPKGYSGMALFPFVILKHPEYKTDAALINHEKIHLRQQIELLILPFFVWYLFEFLIRLVVCKNKNEAYKNISFEQEAYKNEANLHYLKTRKWYEFANYLRKYKCTIRK